MRRLNDKEAMGYIGDAQRILDRLNANIAEIHRRGRFAARDGYPSGGDGVSGGGGVSDPTGTTAISPVPVDIVLRTIEKIDMGIVQAAKILQVAEGQASYVLNLGESERGRQSSVHDCRCCPATVTGVGNDRLRQGFCRACYTAWMKYAEQRDDPSRNVFITQRRQWLVEQQQEAS